jgi:hypothetical protein
MKEHSAFPPANIGIFSRFKYEIYRHESNEEAEI